MDIKEKIERFFLKVEKLSGDDFSKLVATHLDDETVELMVDHIEEFYGVEDEEELGMLAQIMVTGFIAAKEDVTLN